MGDRLLTELAGAVGAAHVLADPELRAGYERDWTGRWRGRCLAVVRPADTAQASAVVRACAAAEAAIVTQGGNTGLVGGGVPRPEGRQVVLSTARLNGIGPIDAATAQLRAGAGVTLAAAQRAAREAGLDLVLDLAARDSATLGGLAACDAGGVRALRHGTARHQIAGIEAVLADGGVVSRMSGLLKDTAGYDLGALLVGSEGTLGVICALRWSLQPRRDARAVALVGLDTVRDAVALARELRPRLQSLEMCELMERAGMELTLAHLGLAAPLELTPVAVLLECAVPTGVGADPLEQLAEALQEAGVAERAVTAADAVGRERLLAIRESHADAIAAEGVPAKFDVGVGLDRLAEFSDRVAEVVARAAPGSRPIVFGHLGDGNLHVNVLGPTAGQLGGDSGEALDAAVLELAAECGGTVSAEHGIGVHKPRYLPLVRSETELRAIRAIKRALDPKGILNPGVGL